MHHTAEARFRKIVRRLEDDHVSGQCLYGLADRRKRSDPPIHSCRLSRHLFAIGDERRLYRGLFFCVLENWITMTSFLNCLRNHREILVVRYPRSPKYPHSHGASAMFAGMSDPGAGTVTRCRPCVIRRRAPARPARRSCVSRGYGRGRRRRHRRRSAASPLPV